MELELRASSGTGPSSSNERRCRCTLPARANALHDLLAQIAALAEVQRSDLRCLLRQIALHNIHSVRPESPRQCEMPPAPSTPPDRACRSTGHAKARVSPAAGRPESHSARQCAIAAHDPNCQPIPLHARSRHRFGQRRQVPCRPALRRPADPSGPRPSPASPGPARNQFHIVHDDEVLQMRQQPVILVGGRSPVPAHRPRAKPSGLPGSGPAHSAPGSRPRRSALRSFTVFVTMPLSQRNRSSPRTATRRIQPRSCTAAP